MLEVITGCMYAGKSSELLRRVRLSQIAGLRCMSYKHSLDQRYSPTHIATHPNPAAASTGQQQQEFGECVLVRNEWELGQALTDALEAKADVISIDEVQFFGKGALHDIFAAADRVRVIVAGLSLDAYGVPFDIMPELLADADEIKRLHAVCTNKVRGPLGVETLCGKKASRTVDLDPKGEQNQGKTPLVAVGSYGKYAARCRHCWTWG